jgi:KaiC/GvpD/RAD55 family RecA-like ATPase
MSSYGDQHIKLNEVAAKERIPTGIDGLDRVIEGLTRGGSILLMGEGGSGKTVFALQFANSVCSRGLRAVFISTAQCARDLRIQAWSSGWDLEKHEMKGLLALVDLAQIQASRIDLSGRKGIPSRKGNFTELLRFIPAGVDVLIMDNLGEYAMGLSPGEFQDGMEFFVGCLNGRGVTALMLMDSAAQGGFKELAMTSVGGAIQLFRWENPRTGRSERLLDVIKMGTAATPIGSLAYELDSGGFDVHLSDDRRRDAVKE